MKRRLYCLLVFAMTGINTLPAQVDEQIRKAVTFYASFDEKAQADFGGGELTLSTRFNHPAEKGRFVFQKGFNAGVFRIARGKGIQGGALEPVDILPDNGRIFFPARGNLAYNKNGWSGAASFWLKTDPNTMLKTGFCDPLQITHRGAANGAIWQDFNNAKPRDLRMGTFPAVPEGGKPIAESDPGAPIVWVKAVDLKADAWRHIALVWDNFDTNREDARTALYIDGRHIGGLRDREIAMDWDLDQVGIYVAVSYIGLLDELALFNRALTPEEVGRLAKAPALLAPLK